MYYQCLKKMISVHLVILEVVSRPFIILLIIQKYILTVNRVGSTP